MLVAIVRWCDEHPDEVDVKRVNEKAFRDMASKDRGLSASQEAWVRGVYERLFDTPVYENLFSSGKVPVGVIKTAVPEVLRKPLPMKPPGRR